MIIIVSQCKTRVLKCKAVLVNSKGMVFGYIDGNDGGEFALGEYEKSRADIVMRDIIDAIQHGRSYFNMPES